VVVVVLVLVLVLASFTRHTPPTPPTC
jgi:hypothetical protein